MNNFAPGLSKKLNKVVPKMTRLYLMCLINFATYSIAVVKQNSGSADGPGVNNVQEKCPTELKFQTRNGTLSTDPMFSRTKCESLYECAERCHKFQHCNSANFIHDGYCELMSKSEDEPNDPAVYFIQSNATYIENIKCIEGADNNRRRTKRAVKFDLKQWVNAHFDNNGAITTTTTLPTVPAVLMAQCGKPVVSPRISKSVLTPSSIHRIVGGYEVVPHSFPWQVSIQDSSGFHSCGGTLLSPNYVMTAGHCVQDDPQLEQAVLVLGAHNVKLNESTQVKVQAKKVITHPKFEMTPDAIYNDFALVELTKPVAYTSAISPLCLSQRDPADGMPCIVSGWGFTYSGQTVTPASLRAVVIPLLNNTVCNNAKHYHGLIDSSGICAGEDGGGKDSCQGDSGGPLTCYDADKKLWSLVGAVSFGEECAMAYRPGVYGRVTSALKWILQQIQS